MYSQVKQEYEIFMHKRILVVGEPGTHLLQASEKEVDLFQCIQFWPDRVVCREVSLNLVTMRKSRHAIQC